MSPAVEPNGGRVTGCILARNEAARISDALRSLEGFAEQVIVLDNESEDATAEIARRHGATVLTAPRQLHFDALRNLAVEHATGDWMFVLDADERMPPRLAPALRKLLVEHGDEFAAVCIPFKHYFCGKWMEHSGWWPGYTRPQLLKKGAFRYNTALHSGVEVDGRTIYFPWDDPDLAIVHYSYDDLHHYLTKLNNYTSGEAESMLSAGQSHSWQAQLAHFVHDWQNYYERGRGDLDGMHGFVLAFMSAFYRFASRAKLWDVRRQQGVADPNEPVPSSLREMLEFMARVTQEGAGYWLAQPERISKRRGMSSGKGRVESPSGGQHSEGTRTLLSPSHPLIPSPANPLLWRSPLFDPSGYADGARHLLLGLIEAGEAVAVAPMRWGEAEAGIPEMQRAAFEQRLAPCEAEAELCVIYTLLPMMRPHPSARFSIGRTMFETDRLPEGVAARLNAMDRIWVPSPFNKETFAASGVDPARIAVVPEAIDPAPFALEVEPWPVPGDAPFKFLSVFDWTLHKGWDVLLDAFVQEFGVDPQVGLLLKVWSSNGYSLEEIRRQADTHLRARHGSNLDDHPNIHLWQEALPAPDMPRVYRAASAFVLPTRGEGWCRPLMEAMAAGLPAIATAWSGLTAFHDGEVGYPVKCAIVPVPAEGAEEIPLYAGHQWAEPDVRDLRRKMRQVIRQPHAAKKKGLAAQERIRSRYSHEAVAAIVQAELAHCRSLAQRGKCLSQSRKEAQRTQKGEKGRDKSKDRGVQSGQGREGRQVGTDREPVANNQLPATNSQLPLPHRPPANLVPIDPVPAVDLREAVGRPVRVRWEGDQTLLSSLALVNRELCLQLLGCPDVELSIVEASSPWHALTERDDPRFARLLEAKERPLSGPPDVTIRHHFPPDWRRPEHGKLIVMQPWEYGHLPREWAAGAMQADEVWAYSRFVRDVYVRSGVPAERIRIVPLGARTDLFAPDGPRLPLRTRKQTRFLFVGGTLERKGADLLLESYRRAFSSSDDVCLIVKDMGTRTFYRGQTLATVFRRAQADLTGPEILYLDEDLTDTELAALYRSCTCVVHPFRAEGFCLSALEGMSSGLPAIVSAGGPTDDYLDDSMTLRVPCRRLPAESNFVGRFECAGNPWQLEPDLDGLVEALRWVHAHPAEAHERGDRCRRQVERGWTWERAAAILRGRLHWLLSADGADGEDVPTSTSLSDASHSDTATTRVKHAPELNAPTELEGRTASAIAGGESYAIPMVCTDPPVPMVTPWRGGTKAKSGKGPKMASCARSPKGQSISLCVIARDEEPRIASCLKSAAPYVDEMIVVDTGSTDQTREIAHACGAKVFCSAWKESFAEARNQSLAQASGAWIFWMDADDVLPPESGKRLRELVRETPTKDVAYQVQVRIPPGPGEFNQAVVDHVKLFPNRPDLQFEFRIHEQILPSLRRAGLDIRFSDADVVHQHYDRSPEGQAKKRLRDFRLLELDLRDRPDHPFTLFNYGMTYLYATKEFEVAAHYLQRSLASSDWKDSIVRKAYALLVTARTCQMDWPTAITANEEGRSYYPHDTELLFQAGQIYQQLGRYAEARRALERLICGEEDRHYRSVDMGLRTYRGRHELALLYRRMGDLDHCAAELNRVVSEYPDYLPAREDLAEMMHRKE